MNATKFSTRSKSRCRSHVPRSAVSSDTTPCSPSELIFFHSAKCPQGAEVDPTRVSAPLDSTTNALNQNKCGTVSR